MKIGAYTICKNEKKYIERGVEKLSELDGLFIGDTGSTDGTYEKLLELQKLYPNLHVCQKTYDPFYFDEARNDSLDFVYQGFEDGDWCFVLDIDEYIEYTELNAIKQQMLNAKPHQIAISVVNQGGNWFWRGHRLNKNYKWFFHLHEALIDASTNKLLFCNKYNLFMQNLVFYHTPETDKPRNYYQRLKKLIEQEPNISHYIVMALMDANQEPDKDYIEYLRCQAITDMCNPNDFHYKDLGGLTYACYGIEDRDSELALQALLAYENTLMGDFPDYRAYHIIIADLLQKRENLDSQTLLLIEKEFLGALRLPQTDGLMEGDYRFSDREVLFSFVMFLYYKKQDYISAAFYAQQLKELKDTEWSNNNYKICREANTEKRSWILLFTSNNYIDGVITTIKTLQATETVYPISVLVTKDVCIQNIEILISLGVHIFLVDKIKPVNSGKEIPLERLENLYQPGFHAALSKFYIYNLTLFDKIVYLDSDIGVRKNMDDLFNKPNYSAINNGCGLEDLFCSALIVIEPNADVYNNLLQFFNDNYSNRSTLVHDQDVLQQYFKDYWYAHPELQLPIEYCLGTTYYKSGVKDGKITEEEFYFDLLDIKSYHMIYKKPGTHGRQFFEQFKDTDPCYYALVNRYIELVNYCVKQVKNAGFDSPYLTYIQ